ncbi:glycoside hydrolase family 2 protein [Photobacterium sanguinicancri]|uniref:beta-mannosidase n=1 Tax=Photobacterium sanguinicancri TaxID=875932 RepID=A0ABX4G0R9_9GAMM|nr:glycoside hydrolase family 2 TIM barrel-domain containing protein [Photobacterium sanguinicancri]OZS44758.1 beta-mannosidase [Photobacterium sanguinicancri]
MRIAFATMALFSLSSCAIQQSTNDWQTTTQSLNGLWRLEIIDDQQRQSTSQNVNVPNNWYLEGIDHAGVAIYQRKFDTNISEQSRYWLVFDAVDYEAKVSVNGEQVTAHTGYFSPFGAEISHLIRDRNNNVEVWVNSPNEAITPDWSLYKTQIKGVLNHHDTRPGGAWSDAGQDKNSGGIWGDVALKVTGPTAIASLTVVPTLDLPSRRSRTQTSKPSLKSLATTTTQASVSLTVNNLSSQPVSFSYRLFEGNSITPVESYEQSVNVKAGEQTINWQLPKKVRDLWWPWDWGKPSLYRLEVTASINGKVTDKHATTIGFRQVEFKEAFDEKENKQKGQFYVNGLPYFVRGTNYIGSQWLGELTANDYQRDITLMKSANINSVRVHAHVAGKAFYDKADQAGVLVWQDFPLQWGYSDAPEFKQEAVKQVAEMTTMLANHPSIAFWSGHNEPPWDADWMKYKYPSYQPAQNQLLTEAVYQQLLKAKDKRIVRKASYTKEHPWLGWYSGDYKDYSTATFTPIVSEFGAQAMPSLTMVKHILGGEWVWPLTEQNIAKLNYHNYQPHETLMLAKVAQGESLSQFHQNSQEYQRVVTKYASEHLRLNKGEGVAAIYQFMFVDSWPSITWSVLDVTREAKSGYRALKQAYQPVIAVVERDLYSVKAHLSVTVINDSLAAYPKAMVWIRNQFDDKQWVFDGVDLPANSKKVVIEESNLAGISGAIIVGITDQNGTEISRNIYNFQDK